MKNKFRQLLKRRDELQSQIKELTNDLINVECEITKSCEHTSLVPRSSYSYGGYDYQGEDRTWDVCSHCGKTFNLKIRLTGFG